MALPAGWPGRPASGVRSIRFYVSGTASANFSDNAYLFIDTTGANPYTPLPQIDPGANTTLTVPPVPQGTGTFSTGMTLTGVAVADKALIWSGNIRICNDDGGASLEYSFDGTNVHGLLKKGEQFLYCDRYECGIAIRGVGRGTPDFRVEAW